MTPAETLDLLGRERRTQLCGIVAQILEGVPETTIEPTTLRGTFLGAGPELNVLSWYDLLAAAAEVVSEGCMTIRRADPAIFKTEVLGSAHYLAVLPAENAPDRVGIGDSFAALYWSGVSLKFHREQTDATN